MKGKLSKIFLILSLVFLFFLIFTVIPAYMIEHTYYFKMLRSLSNWEVTLSAVVCSFLPVLYVLFSRKKNILMFLLNLFIGLFIFGILFFTFKDSLMSSGAVLWFINSLLIFVLSVVFIVSILSLGILLKDRFLKLKNQNIFDVLLSFGIGLASFCVINYIMILLGVFYSLLSWFLLIVLVGCSYLVRNELKEINQIFSRIFESFSFQKILENKILFFGICLLVFSIAYYYFGFLNSFIPYPTAWDANHAYMFNPKMWAHNNGFFWSVQAMFTNPYMWLGYIAFWFNLFVPFEGFWISPASIAVEMNFLSGIFVLLMGIALIKEVVNLCFLYLNKKTEDTSNLQEVEEKIDTYLDEQGDYAKLDSLYSTQKNKEKTQIPFYIGRLLLLLWLTSGMGAFLVFVDNKTDLGVLTMIIMAVYSGFVFLSKLKSSKEITKSHLKYIGISGFMFAIAVLAKPTAFFDVVNFGLLLIFLWMGILGVIGIYLLVVGLLTYIKFRGIGNYFPSSFAKIPMILGAAFGFGELLKTFLREQFKSLKYIFLWVGVFALTLLFLKGPFEIAEIVVKDKGFNFVEFGKDIFLGKKDQKDNKKEEGEKTLLASLYSTSHLGVVSQKEPKNQNQMRGDNNPSSSDNCSLKSQGFDSKEGLYSGLKEAPGNTRKEDVGRYVGYGWKNFKDPFWSFMFPGNNYCLSNDESADLLCENSEVISNFEIKKFSSLLKKLPQDSKGYKLLSGIINTGTLANKDLGKIKVTEDLLGEYEDSLSNIKNFYKDRAIKVQKTCVANPDTKIKDKDCIKYDNKDLPVGKIVYGKKISVPFKYIIPFNITFNRSLQNESSYYTDIGYIWLFLLLFLPVALCLGILKRDRFLTALSIVTILGWSIWFFVAGAILWYGIGLIIWTILSFVSFLFRLSGDYQNNDFEKYVFVSFISFFVFICLYQLLLNFVRISSQGGSGPFLWYKQSSGQERVVNQELSSEKKNKIPYSWKDVFDRQFPHYNKFIDLANNRKEGERIFLAGTYSRYFIKDQSGIRYDQFLMSLWELFSDSNVCNSYLRLKDEKYKYITIDPNIGTVVMGGGNESLFDRFFGKINPVKGKVEKDGVITMLVKLVRGDYLKYVYTNNIGAKYGFTLDDNIIRNNFEEELSDEDILLLRSVMVGSRYPRVQNLAKEYFDGNKNGIIHFIINIAYQRIQNGDFIGDIADMHGKDVDEYKLKNLASKVMNLGQISSRSKQLEERDNVQKEMAKLSEKERNVLSQYLSIIQLMNSKEQSRLSNILQKMVMESISSSSQIMTFEVK